MTRQAVMIQYLRIVFLVELVWLNMAILIGTNIQDTELDLIDLTHTLVVDWKKRNNFWSRYKIINED